MLAERLSSADGAVYSGAWNFGPSGEDVRTVGDIASLFSRAWPEPAEWEACPDEGAPHEAETLRLDISKTRADLGWSPRWSIEDAVAATASWYLAAANGENMRRFSIGQIESYLAKGPA
jgi:CDP-glucose 4,6-dehydratase